MSQFSKAEIESIDQRFGFDVLGAEFEGYNRDEILDFVSTLKPLPQPAPEVPEEEPSLLDGSVGAVGRGINSIVGAGGTAVELGGLPNLGREIRNITDENIQQITIDFSPANRGIDKPIVVDAPGTAAGMKFNPDLTFRDMFLKTLEQTPNLFGAGAAGLTIARGLAAASAKTGVTKALVKKYGEKKTQQIITDVGGATGGFLAEGALEGAFAAREIQDIVETAPLSALEQSAMYQQFIGSGMNPSEARKAVADSLAKEGGFDTAIQAGALGAPMGIVFNRMARLKRLTFDAPGKAATPGTLKKMGVGFVGETGQELSQTGVGLANKNQASIDAGLGPLKSIDVANELAASALTAGAPGAGFAIIADGSARQVNLKKDKVKIHGKNFDVKDGTIIDEDGRRAAHIDEDGNLSPLEPDEIIPPDPEPAPPDPGDTIIEGEVVPPALPEGPAPSPQLPAGITDPRERQRPVDGDIVTPPPEVDPRDRAPVAVPGETIVPEAPGERRALPPGPFIPAVVRRLDRLVPNARIVNELANLSGRNPVDVLFNTNPKQIEADVLTGLDRGLRRGQISPQVVKDIKQSIQVESIREILSRARTEIGRIQRGNTSPGEILNNLTTILPADVTRPRVAPEDIGRPLDDLEDVQDFAGIKIEEDVLIRETGESVRLEESVQRKYNQLVKRKNALIKLRRCVNAS